jgi:hypothetical protein
MRTPARARSQRRLPHRSHPHAGASRARPRCAAAAHQAATRRAFEDRHERISATRISFINAVTDICEFVLATSSR